jgi:hypothetical protein
MCMSCLFSFRAVVAATCTAGCGLAYCVQALVPTTTIVVLNSFAPSCLTVFADWLHAAQTVDHPLSTTAAAAQVRVMRTKHHAPCCQGV